MCANLQLLRRQVVKMTTILKIMWYSSMDFSHLLRGGRKQCSLNFQIAWSPRTASLLSMYWDLVGVRSPQTAITQWLITSKWFESKLRFLVSSSYFKVLAIRLLSKNFSMFDNALIPFHLMQICYWPLQTQKVSPCCAFYGLHHRFGPCRPRSLCCSFSDNNLSGKRPSENFLSMAGKLEEHAMQYYNYSLDGRICRDVNEQEGGPSCKAWESYVINKGFSLRFSALLSSDFWQPTLVALIEESGTEEDLASVCIWPLSNVVVWALGPCRLPRRVQESPLLGARPTFHLQQNLTVEVSDLILHHLGTAQKTHCFSYMKVLSFHSIIGSLFSW